MNNPDQSNHPDVTLDIGGSSNSSLDKIPTPSELPSTYGIGRDEYLDKCVKLHQAAMNGDWKAAKSILDQHERFVRVAITNKCETALHVAAAAKRKGFVKNLLTRMDRSDLALKNTDNNTAICFAAASGVKEIAEMMVDMNEDLPLIRGNGGMIPLYMAALFGHSQMVSYLSEKTNFKRLTRGELVNIFHAIISADIYDVALLMLDEYPELAIYRSHTKQTALHLLACKPSAIACGEELGCFKRSANYVFKGIFRKELMQTLGHQLLKKLWTLVLELPDQKVSDLLRTPSRLLFDAAASGNVEFLVILIRSYPDLVWKVDEKNRSLFHVAALYRHESIFNIIFELGAIKDLIAAYKEKDTENKEDNTENKEKDTKNNMLHLVARLPPPNRLQTVSGPALQMQRELLWLKAVKEIVPQKYIEKKNSKNQLALDLFTEEHKDLRKDGEKWMKDTATSCMLVATLIATVVFGAAFTVPGGYGKDGLPLLWGRSSFNIFILSDAVALFASSTSIVIFLSILTSRYAEDDFLVTLPLKLMMGLLALFGSIIAMVMAFSATLLLVYNEKMSGKSILIICLAAVTGLSFVLLHFQLWFDTLRSAFWSKFLFQGRKRRLYR